MMNEVVLLGRIYQDIVKDEDNKSYELILEVPRSYKNENGLYDFDIIPIVLTENMGNQLLKCCKKR